ncbi:DUF4259 domain-containing protein [Lysobacter silvisoli]|nr:DUF4259 domain-containing protein [Lysobacter silvisoli]
MKSLIALLLLAFAASAHAGTWDYGQFDNDQALDTASDWAESGSVDSVRNALTSAHSARYLASPEGVDALVAAEVVAAAMGRPSKKLPADLAAWLRQQPADRLRALAPQAQAAIARVRDAKGSELYELWAEAELERWLAQLDELSSRLGAAARAPAR